MIPIITAPADEGRYPVPFHSKTGFSSSGFPMFRFVLVFFGQQANLCRLLRALDNHPCLLQHLIFEGSSNWNSKGFMDRWPARR